MDVTQHNFEPVSRAFGTVLNNTDFIAIDLEMSGLRLPNEAWRPGYLYTDLIPSVYQKYREVIQKFDIIQIGVCLFQERSHSPMIGDVKVQNQTNGDGKVQPEKRLKAFPFNFFVLPRAIEGFQFPYVGIDPETMDFHTRMGFDFKKWLEGGISMCTSDVEKKLEDKIYGRSDGNAPGNNAANRPGGITPVNNRNRSSAKPDGGDAESNGGNAAANAGTQRPAEKDGHFKGTKNGHGKDGGEGKGKSRDGKGKDRNGRDGGLSSLGFLSSGFDAKDDLKGIGQSDNKSGKEGGQGAPGTGTGKGGDNQNVPGKGAGLSVTTSNRPQGDIVLSRPEDVKWMEELWEKIETFMKAEPTFEEGDDLPIPLELPFFNAFRAKALRQRLEKAFPDSFLESIGHNQRVLHKSFTEEQKVLVEERKQQELEERDRAWREKMYLKMGFRKIWQMLKSSMKPIVFHNGLYDVLFLFHNLEMPLPETVYEFKTEFNRRIKNQIIDTKIPSEEVMMERYRGKIPFSSLEEMTKLTTDVHGQKVNMECVVLQEEFKKHGEKFLEKSIWDYRPPRRALMNNLSMNSTMDPAGSEPNESGICNMDPSNLLRNNNAIQLANIGGGSLGMVLSHANNMSTAANNASAAGGGGLNQVLKDLDHAANLKCFGPAANSLVEFECKKCEHRLKINVRGKLQEGGSKGSDATAERKSAAANSAVNNKKTGTPEEMEKYIAPKFCPNCGSHGTLEEKVENFLNKYHDAAFDAMQTGKLMVMLSHFENISFTPYRLPVSSSFFRFCLDEIENDILIKPQTQRVRILKNVIGQIDYPKLKDSMMKNADDHDLSLAVPKNFIQLRWVDTMTAILLWENPDITTNQKGEEFDAEINALLESMEKANKAAFVQQDSSFDDQEILSWQTLTLQQYLEGMVCNNVSGVRNEFDPALMKRGRRGVFWQSMEPPIKRRRADSD